MPLVKEAWLAGEISASHVRRLAKARNRRTEEAFSASEAMLVNHATTMGFRQFTTVLAYWMLHADPDGAEESDLERHNRRRAACDETLNGMFSGSYLLDAIGGTILSNELRRLEAKLFEADWAEAKERLGRDPLVSELARTPDQRRADALVEMAERSAGNVENKKAKPYTSLLVHVGVEVLVPESGCGGVKRGVCQVQPGGLREGRSRYSRDLLGEPEELGES